MVASIGVMLMFRCFAGMMFTVDDF